MNSEAASATAARAVAALPVPVPVPVPVPPPGAAPGSGSPSGAGRDARGRLATTPAGIASSAAAHPMIQPPVPDSISITRTASDAVIDAAAHQAAPKCWRIAATTRAAKDPHPATSSTPIAGMLPEWSGLKVVGSASANPTTSPTASVPSAHRSAMSRHSRGPCDVLLMHPPGLNKFN
ncbi:hypothetical protein [Streptomyces sp. NPDC006459]|uniref:hypothetical protein n=1 Tax=Streptomyces sp. NPDC006459 TaxID=3154303 RepID=UPI0033ADDB70